MLSLKQQQTVVSCVDEMTKAENKEEILNYFLMCFCSDVENCNITLRAIPQIAERMNSINNRKLLEYSNALSTTYNYIGMSRACPDGLNLNNAKFSMLVSMFKPKFPDGKLLNASQYTKQLFAEMVSYIQDGSGFKINDKQSWEFAESDGIKDFLVNVIKNNIDEKFECSYGK